MSAFYTLPTEAEWEYACRAGSKTAYYWGDKWDDDYAWSNSNCLNGPRQKGMKKPNAWGLFDMSGNLYELCFSNYEKYDGKDKFGRSTKFPNKGKIVVRGGSWSRDPKTCRSANRGSLSYNAMRYDVGFRIVIVRRPLSSTEVPE